MIMAALTYIACMKVVFMGMEKMMNDNRVVTVKKGRDLK